MGSFTNILIVPIFIINCLGGIISGIWLVILGEWGLIGYGMLAAMMGGFIIPLAILPSAIFALPAVALMTKGHKFIGYMIGTLSVTYIMIVLSAWCLIVLTTYADQATPDSIIPILIWSYGVALGPISYLAHEELQSGNELSGLSTFFLQIAYFITILVIIFVGINVFHALVIFGVVMTVAIIYQFHLVYKYETRKRE
jgi:hypothetical protein